MANFTFMILLVYFKWHKVRSVICSQIFRVLVRTTVAYIWRVFEAREGILFVNKFLDTAHNAGPMSAWKKALLPIIGSFFLLILNKDSLCKRISDIYDHNMICIKKYVNLSILIAFLWVKYGFKSSPRVIFPSNCYTPIKLFEAPSNTKLRMTTLC